MKKILCSVLAFSLGLSLTILLAACQETPQKPTSNELVVEQQFENNSTGILSARIVFEWKYGKLAFVKHIDTYDSPKSAKQMHDNLYAEFSNLDPDILARRNLNIVDDIVTYDEFYLTAWDGKTYDEIRAIYENSSSYSNGGSGWKIIETKSRKK